MATISSHREDVSSELTFTLEEWARANNINTQILKDKFSNISPRDERIIALILDRPVITCYMERVDAAWSIRHDEGANSYFKNDTKAKELRLQGDDHLTGKRYTEALYCYTQALRFASCERTLSTEGNELVLAYSARSGLLFQLEHWSQSISDIRMALKYGCPTVELEERKKRCEAKLLQERKFDQMKKSKVELFKGDKEEERKLTEAFTGLGLSSASESASIGEAIGGVGITEEPEPTITKANPKMPAVSIKVTETMDPKRGRGLKATEQVKFGEILAKEVPYANTLFIDCFDDYCQSCCKPLDGHTIPCPGCSVVQYCSRECKKIDKVHWKYTCHPQLPHIYDPLIQLMLRIVCRSFMPEVRSPPQIKSKPSTSKVSTATTTTTTTTSTTATATKDENDPVTLTNYSSFRKLCHPPKASPDYVLPSIYVGLLVRKMFYSLKNNQGVVIPKLGVLIPHIFLHYHRLLINKIFLVDQEEPITLNTSPVSVDERGEKIGLAIYPTLALINHDCVPNTFLFFHGPKAIIRAARTIEPDQELTICYGPSYASETYTDRQRKLFDWYYFKCECEVCTTQSTSCQICYKCPKCSKPLVVNEDGTNQCTECDAVNIIGSDVIKLIGETISSLNRGRSFYEQGDLDSAVKILSKCYNDMDDHLYRSHCDLIRARTFLSECLTSMGHHKMASKLTAVNVNVTGELCGWESVDYVCVMITYISYLYKDLEDSWDEGDKQSIVDKSNQIISLIDEQIERLKRITRLVDPSVNPSTVFSQEMKSLTGIKEQTQRILSHLESSQQ